MGTHALAPCGDVVTHGRTYANRRADGAVGAKEDVAPVSAAPDLHHGLPAGACGDVQLHRHGHRQRLAHVRQPGRQAARAHAHPTPVGQTHLVAGFHGREQRLDGLARVFNGGRLHLEVLRVLELVGFVQRGAQDVGFPRLAGVGAPVPQQRGRWLQPHQVLRRLAHQAGVVDELGHVRLCGVRSGQPERVHRALRPGAALGIVSQPRLLKMPCELSLRRRAARRLGDGSRFRQRLLHTADGRAHFRLQCAQLVCRERVLAQWRVVG